MAAQAVALPLADAGAPSPAPALADMSVAPPPGTDATPPAPPAIASTGAAPGGTSDASPSATAIGTPLVAELPAGATPCQPSICPPFDAGGSLTNTQGNADPTQAGGYLIAADKPASGAATYPDLGSLPTLILPFVPVTVGAPAT